LLASDGIRFVPNARVYYRMSGFNRLSYIGRSDKKIDAQFLSVQMHIDYLRSIEESERMRAACLNYLQGLLFFYPERPDIIAQGEQLARSLGGHLAEPRLPWKYAWIGKLIGWRLAKRAQLGLPRIKWSLIQRWDKFLSRFDKGDPADEPDNRSLVVPFL